MGPRFSIFISHVTDEQVEANKAKQYLEQVFKDKVEVFVASSWTSIQPGEDWFACISDAIEKADIMLVLCSGDSVNRPWIQFEAGAAWFAKKTKVIPICHKGMTPSALPEPIRRLQAVDINAESEAQQLHKLAQAISTSGSLPDPTPISIEQLPLGSTVSSQSSLRGWILRPTAHIGNILEGIFRVGSVDVADAERAREAGLDPNDTVFVRLYVEPPNGQYLNTMASGAKAVLFESDDVDGKVIIAKLKLAATHPSGGDRASPVIVIQDARVRSE